MSENEVNLLLRKGIEAAKQNNRIIARDYFRRVIELQPTNETAWLWMAQASDDAENRRRALQRVLQINPNNSQARTALQKLESSMPRRSDDADESLSGLRQSAIRGSAPPSEGVEQERDWFQPIDRTHMPPELWASRRSQRMDPFVLLMVAAVAVAAIGIAALLLYDYIQSQDEDEEPQVSVLDESFTATADALAVLSLVPPTITNTPRPTIPIELQTSVANAELPPQPTATATSTPIPSPTRTPTPNPPSLYTMLFSSSEVPGDPQVLFVIDGDGNNLNRLTVTLPQLQLSPNADPELVTDGPVELLDPSYSPDMSQIVFTAQIGDVQELFIAPAGGGAARQATVLSATQTRDAAWSPKGDWIAFASNADGDFDLYLLDPLEPPQPDGTIRVSNITNNEFEDREPSWAPNNRHIAFATDRAGAGAFEIFVIPVQGSDECRMTNAAGSSTSPSWSPDGSHIAFISNRNRDNDLFIMRSDGSGETPISINERDNWQERDPAWSADGEWLVVSSTRSADGAANLTSKLWMVTPDGNNWTQVTVGNSNDLGAIFSRSGSILNEDFEFRCNSQ